MNSPRTIEEIDFVSPVVDARGQVIEQRPGRARLWREPLPAGQSLELIEVPGGTLRMGSLRGQGYADEQPQHFVQVAGFWMGRTPVTEGQWRALMGRHRGRFTEPDGPVDTISWTEAAKFCERLSKAAGRRYGLPSEALWEYACRAGSITDFSFGPVVTSDLANYNGEFVFQGGPKGVYRHKTLPVGQFPPNAFGLQEMHGTLWEWCADAWHDDYSGAPADGNAWQGGLRAEYRVARGGCWHDIPEVCRSAARLRAKADEGDEFMGLRVVLLEFSPK
jgi:formylglycine-generating enzyme required for sulfatase activity